MKGYNSFIYHLFLQSVLVFNLLGADESPLSFYPKFSTQFFSTGSILHPDKSGSSLLNSVSLGANKSTGSWTIAGNYKFITGNNADISSTYFNPGINIENQRGYYNVDDTWFESSTLSITYHGGENFKFYFGKERIHWGMGQSSLMLSKNTPAYPLAGFNWAISKNLKLEYIAGSLSSLIEDTSNTDYQDIENRKVYRSRGLAAHRLIWTLSDQFTFIAMESVIFGNRKIDEHYLLPFIPFWSMQHYIGDTDNVQMCGELNWKLNQNVLFYGSLFVDEWRPEWTFKETNRNWFGYQLGLTLKNFQFEKDFLRLEHTWTDHRVYRHKYPINESYSFNYSLGFWAGPHAEETFLGYYFFFKDINISSTISNAKRGKLTNEMVFNQYKDIRDERFEGGNESRLILSTKIKKGVLGQKIFLTLEGQWIQWDNAGFDPMSPETDGNDISKFSVNIGLIALTEILFD